MEKNGHFYYDCNSAAFENFCIAKLKCWIDFFKTYKFRRKVRSTVARTVCGGCDVCCQFWFQNIFP